MITTIKEKSCLFYKPVVHLLATVVVMLFLSNIYAHIVYPVHS